MSTGFRHDVALLIVRLGLGPMFMVHGEGKLFGGPERWVELGKAVEVFGIDFWPVAWGFAAAVAEFVGGLCLALGLGTRVASALMLCTMVVAACVHFDKGDGLAGASHAIEAGAVFLAMALTGPGRFSIDGWWQARRPRRNADAGSRVP